MKTDAILLQPFDNIDSILDKLLQASNAGGAARRILLIWPKRGRLIEDALEMGRLKNWLKQNDVSAALVVSNPFVRALALEHGFTVFADRADAETKKWDDFSLTSGTADEYPRLQKIAELQSERNGNQRKGFRSPMTFVGFILMLLSVAGLLVILLPHVTITLPAVHAEQQLNIPFWTSDALSSVTQNGGVPSQIELIELTLQTSVPASGRYQSSGKLASGTVSLYSTCGRTQQIASGTQIFDGTGALVFETTQAISLNTGEVADVPLMATMAGTVGNLIPFSLTGIESPFDLCVAVRQFEATEGGDDGYFTAPQRADYDKASEIIQAQVNESAEKAIEAKYGSLRIALPGETSIESILSDDLTPGIGFVGEHLNLRQKLMVRVRTVSAQDIGAAAKIILDAQKAPGFLPADDGLRWAMETTPQAGEDDAVLWSMDVRRAGAITPDVAGLKKRLAGTAIRDVNGTVAKAGIAIPAFTIRPWPAWITHFPLIPENIWIRMEE